MVAVGWLVDFGFGFDDGVSDDFGFGFGWSAQNWVLNRQGTGKGIGQNERAFYRKQPSWLGGWGLGISYWRTPHLHRCRRRPIKHWPHSIAHCAFDCGVHFTFGHSAIGSVAIGVGTRRPLWRGGSSSCGHRAMEGTHEGKLGGEVCDEGGDSVSGAVRVHGVK